MHAMQDVDIRESLSGAMEGLEDMQKDLFQPINIHIHIHNHILKQTGPGCHVRRLAGW